MRYTIQAFTDNSLTEMIGDWSNIASGISIEDGERGADRASMFIPMGLDAAFNLYAKKALPHLVISYESAKWIGRIEDRAIANGGVNISVYGYWRALHDTKYTALWSDTSTRRWETAVGVSYNPEFYEVDFNNRLSLIPRGGESFTWTTIGACGYRIPDKSTREIKYIEMDYSFLAPNATWLFSVWATDNNFTVASVTVENSIAGNGAVQTGTISLSLSADTPAIVVTTYYSSATPATVANTGDVNLKITNIRVKTKTGTIYADDIIEDMIGYIDAGQLSHSMAMVQSPAIDLEDVIYEDKSPSQVLADLEYRGDSNTPPRVWTSAVYGQMLEFRPVGEDTGRHWYIDIPAIDLQKTIDALSTSVYSTYQDENGRTLRTDTETNDTSVITNGIDRTFAARARTTSQTQAELVRDAELTERGEVRPRSSIHVKKVYNASGGLVPLIEPKRGDFVTIRNLPNIGAELNNIQTFQIARKTLTPDGLDIYPSRELPSVSSLLAEALG